MSVAGPLTLQELKRALLLIVREDGWQQPVLWDFREVTEVQLGYTDLVGIVDFIEHFMAHFPPHGPAALLATSPTLRALAMTYRALHLRPRRTRNTVVDTLAAGDAWLDTGAVREEQPRAMRFDVRDAIGSLDGVATEIVNVSHSGALLVTPHAPGLGEEHHFILTVGATAVDMRVRLVRAQPHETAGAQRYWRLAVEFLAPAEALEQLRTLIRVQGE